MSITLDRSRTQGEPGAGVVMVVPVVVMIGGDGCGVIFEWRGGDGCLGGGDYWVIIRADN